MQIVEKKITELKEYENNPRNNDDAVEAVAESIQQFGFKVPIVIDSNGVIIAGHTRRKAAVKLGLDTVPCIIADDLTPEQIQAFRLADNKTAELAEWDFEALEKELAELTAFDVDMSLFGFDEAIFDEVMPIDRYDISEEEKGSLTEKFVVPPFSVLDSRRGYWTDRKRLWREKIQDNAEARKNAIVCKNTFGQSFNEVSLLDPVLSEIIVKWFAPEHSGSKCFDVFAGDTVFGFVSSYLGNSFTGIELRQEQVDFNNARCKEFDLQARYICDDGRNVLQHLEESSQDLLFSCPPYFDIEVYSDDERDASNQSTYADFFGVLDTAFSNAIKCLKENRFAVIVVGDVRDKKDGFYYDFCGDIKRCFARNGMKLYNELILANPIGTAALRVNKYMRTRKMVKVHQNVLVFYKGDTKAISKHFEEIDFTDLEGAFDESENE